MLQSQRQCALVSPKQSQWLRLSTSSHRPPDRYSYPNEHAFQTRITTMTRTLRILIAGESWETLSFHQKGFDVFTTTFYYEGVGPLRAALEGAGHAVDYMPSHIAATKFPIDLAGLHAFDVV